MSPVYSCKDQGILGILPISCQEVDFDQENREYYVTIEAENGKVKLVVVLFHEDAVGNQLDVQKQLDVEEKKSGKPQKDLRRGIHHVEQVHADLLQ